ncbi:MAG: hypothetical protein IKG69_03875 [Atopobiaceae bacterium]|nr:hypothetical protein [Atopobiaceae bacterium]
MPNETARSIAGVYEIQHYLAFKDSATGEWGTNMRVTEDTAFDTSNDDNTYEPEYLDRKVQPKYTMGRKTSIEFEVDAVLPGEIQVKLYEVEDELNVPVLYTRTVGVDFSTGEALDATALAAKQAPGTLTMNPLSGEASGPVKLTGSVALTDEFTRGTFNASTATFTPDGEGSSEDTGEDTGEG